MKEYRYNKYGKISPGLSGKTGAIVMLLTVLVPLCLTIATGELRLIAAFLILVFFYGIMIFGFAFWSNIKCDKSALYLEFLGWYIEIPWNNILGIKKIKYSPQNAWLVTAKKVTILHYSYGLLFSFRLVPGFLIWESISNHSDLLSNIKRNAKIN